MKKPTIFYGGLPNLQKNNVFTTYFIKKKLKIQI